MAVFVIFEFIDIVGAIAAFRAVAVSGANIALTFGSF